MPRRVWECQEHLWHLRAAGGTMHKALHLLSAMSWNPKTWISTVSLGSHVAAYSFSTSTSSYLAGFGTCAMALLQLTNGFPMAIALHREATHLL